MTRDEALVALLVARLELSQDDATRDDLLRRLDARRAGRAEKTTEETSPLFHAATGAQPFTRTLVETPFEVDLQAWSHAPESSADFIAIVRALVASGENLHERAGPAGFTPLHVAVYAGRADIAAELCALGADEALLDTWGRSPERMKQFVSLRRLLRLFACQPSVRTAYLSQLYLPVSHQFTTPILQLELSGNFPSDAFAKWPHHEPLTVTLLADDPTSRLVRLGIPIYRAGELRMSSELALTLAARLGGSAYRVSSAEHEGDPFFVSSASGAVPLLVRRFGSHFSVSLADGTAFQPDVGEPTAAAVPEIVAATEAWLEAHGAVPSLFQMAWAARHALQRELSIPFDVTLPGTASPTELWLRSGGASVGVFPSGVRVWTGHESTVAHARSADELDALSARVVEAVERQLVLHGARVELSQRIEALSLELLNQLKNALPALGDPSQLDVSVHGVTSHDSTLRGQIQFTDAVGRHVLAEIDSERGRIVVHAGLFGSDGVEYETDGLPLSESTVSSLVTAMRLATTALTLQRMRSGRRYRVLADLRGLRAGEVVVYEGFNDIDNHYGEHEFIGEDGREVKLGGDCSSRGGDPLSEVHRYLEALEA